MPIDQEALEELSFAVNDARSKYIRMLRLVDRVMAHACNPFELCILRFVLDRTYAYGKEQERIPENHFLEGVYTSEGQCLHPPLNMSKGVFYKYLQSLQKNKMIVKIPGNVRQAPSYMLNIEWDFANISKGRNKMPLNRPKAKRYESTTRTNRSTTRTNESTTETAIVTLDSNVGFKPSVETTAGPKAILSTILNDITSQTSLARDRAKQKGNTASIVKIWEDAWKQGYPDEPYFTPTISNQIVPFRNAIKRGVSNHHVADFISWVVLNYSTVIKAKFKWMAKISLTPRIGFITKHIDVFYTAFVDDIDPNRKIDRRIRDHTETITTEQKRIAELEKQVSILTKQKTLSSMEPLNEARAEKAAEKISTVKRIIRSRRSRSDEFGKWGE